MTRRTEAARYECRAAIGAEELRELRAKHRYSALEWASKWGISATAIYQWERGERPIPCWVDRALADLELDGPAKRKRPAPVSA